MDQPAKPAATTTAAAHRLDEMGAVRALIGAIRTRILSGLFLVLPAVITVMVIAYLYNMLKSWVIDPVASQIVHLADARLGGNLPGWWINYFSPVLAIVLILSILYFLGYFVRSRLFRAFDWIMLHVPGVTTVYKGVSSIVSSLQGDPGTPKYNRVVLVPFPYPGSKALAFVTKALRDRGSDRTILCVAVLTGVVPPAGFTLFVPEEDVIDVDWTVDQTLQAILTGGLTCPNTIPFSQPSMPGHGLGPILDTHGAPIEHPPVAEPGHAT